MVSYVHQSGNWKYFSKETIAKENVPLRRYLDFNSNQADSFVQRFQLLGYKDGSVALMIHYQSGLSDTPACLREQGITPGAVDRHAGMYMSKNHDELKRLFKVITSQGEIQAPYFEKISKVVMKGMHSLKKHGEPINALSKNHYVYPFGPVGIHYYIDNSDRLKSYTFHPGSGYINWQS